MKTLARLLQCRVTPFTLFFGFLGIAAAATLCIAGVNLYLQGRGPTFEGRNMAEWLRVLRTGTNSTEHPLRIVRLICDDAPHCDAVEVPTSWDLVHKYGLARTDDSSHHYGMFTLLVNGVYFRVIECRRATNGNCLLRFSTPYPRTNDITVFLQFGDGEYRMLEATGPCTRVVREGTMTASPTSGLSQ
jgi:hypothetical protein